MKFNRSAIIVSAALMASLVVATPSYANVPSIAVTVAGVADNDANTVAGAAVVTVPSDNRVDAVDAVRFAMSGIETGTTISVRSTNASLTRALHTTAVPVAADSGTVSLSINTGTGTTVEFFAFTKSIETGTVVITSGGNTFTYYLKGTAGVAYNVALTANTSVATGTTVENNVLVTDVFGNPVAGETPTVTVIGATVDTAATATDAKGVSKFALKYGATAGQVAVSVSVNAADVVGLPKANKSVIRFITVSDLAAEVARLTAEVATLKETLNKTIADSQVVLAAAKAEADAAKAELAAVKRDFNRLANRWNKRFPRAQVDLKK